MNVNLRFKATWAALAIILMAPLAGVRAQSTGGAAASAPTKIGVLNVRNAIVATAEGKQAQAQLQSQFAPKQNELQSTQKQIEDVQRRLSEGARTLSEDEKTKLQRQGELLTRRLQRDNDGLNEELNAAQGEIVDGIGRKMLDVLDRYARENGYVAVLGTSAQGSPVVYGSSQTGITQEVVPIYDQSYPVKSCAPHAYTPSPPPNPSTPSPANKPAP